MFCCYCTPVRHEYLSFYLSIVFTQNSSLVLVIFCMILTFYGCQKLMTLGFFKKLQNEKPYCCLNFSASFIFRKIQVLGLCVKMLSKTQLVVFLKVKYFINKVWYEIHFFCLYINIKVFCKLILPILWAWVRMLWQLIKLQMPQKGIMYEKI